MPPPPRHRGLSTVHQVMEQERLAFQVAARTRVRAESTHSPTLRITADKLKAIFSLFDSDESGSIASDELGLVLHAIGVEVDAATLKTLQAQGTNDRFTLEQFKTVLNSSAAPMDSAAEAERVFDLIDFARTGVITVDGLKDALLRSDARVSDEEIREVLKHCDVDEDGVVSRTDFLAVMKFVSEIGL